MSRLIIAIILLVTCLAGCEQNTNTPQDTPSPDNDTTTDTTQTPIMQDTIIINQSVKLKNRHVEYIIETAGKTVTAIGAAMRDSAVSFMSGNIDSSATYGSPVTITIDYNGLVLDQNSLNITVTIPEYFHNDTLYPQLTQTLTATITFLGHNENWQDITNTYFDGNDYEIEVYKLQKAYPQKIRAYYVKFPVSSDNYSLECLQFAHLTTLSDYTDNESKEVLGVINGGYFYNNGSYSLLYHDGQKYAHNLTAVTRNGQSYPLRRGSFALQTNGSPYWGWSYDFAGTAHWYSTPLPTKDTEPPVAPPLLPTDSGTIINMEEGIGGGPMLIYAGNKITDYSPELFQAGFTTSRHPRTAIGTTASGDMIWMTVEGRIAASAGVSCSELADMLKDLGCDNALNLDGGGSTYGYVNGKKLNASSDGRERAVSTAISIIRN